MEASIDWRLALNLKLSFIRKTKKIRAHVYDDTNYNLNPGCCLCDNGGGGSSWLMTCSCYLRYYVDTELYLCDYIDIHRYFYLCYLLGDFLG